MKLNETTPPKPSSTTHTKADLEKYLKDRLKYYILNKKPADLTDTHKYDWFKLNDKNQVVWNWRNRTYPLWLLIDKLFTPESEAKKVHDLFSRNKDWLIVQSVLNSKDVKAFKDSFRKEDKVLMNMKAEIDRLGKEIENAKQRRQELLKVYTLKIAGKEENGD